MDRLLDIEYIQRESEEYKDIATCIRVLEKYAPIAYSELVYNLNKQMEDCEVAVMKHIFGDKCKLVKLYEDDKLSKIYNENLDDLPF